jgi:SAM-dependent methyltransferase
LSATPLVLRDEDGTLRSLEPARWFGPPSDGECDLLSALPGPILDVGCGPGRVVDTLGRRGVMALGVDPAPAAVRLARSKGCAVLQRSVFDRLPGEGRWATVLLLDGNVGIGGDPTRLLRRCRELLRPDDGTIIVEVEPPGTPARSFRARLERGAEAGPWFPWAVVGCDAMDNLANGAALSVSEIQHVEDRWLASLKYGGLERHACA